MANLQHIDLTQNHRFEKIMDAEESDRESKRNNRGIHRLKKGEIPHYSNNISVSSDNNLTSWTLVTNTWQQANDFNITYTMPTISTSWHTLSDTISNIWIQSDSDESINISKLYYVTNLSSITSSTYACDKYELDKSIKGRLHQDPFESDKYTEDTFRRLKSQDNKWIKEKSDIQERLETGKKKIKNFYDCWYDDDQDRIIERLLEGEIFNDIDDSDGLYTFMHSHLRHNKKEQVDLKKRAPFIKRVYTTNRDRSFDDTELRLDMAIAKEHFDASIVAVNL